MKNKIKVALIEPNQLMRQGLVFLLAEQKEIQVVFEAENCWQLPDLILTGCPDIVIVATELPGHREIKMVKSLMTECPDVKIVALSNELNDFSVVALIELGAKALLFNTYHIDQVINALKQVHTKGFYYDEDVTNAVERQIQRSGNGDFQMTKREREVLNLLVLGNSSKEAAAILCISKRTVEGHRQSIIKKTGIKNMLVLKQWSIEHLN